MSNFLLERVQLPQGRRLRGGLLESAEALPEGWERGIQFRTSACAEPELLGPCDVGDSEGVRPSSAAFTPVFIRQGAACSTMSQVGTVNLALGRLEGTTEWALGRALATGVLSANPSFEDADLVHIDASDDVVAAVSCLEQAVADVGFGAYAVLHAPFRAAAYLRSNHLIEWQEDGYYSPAGIQWIISPGYPTSMDSNDDVTVTLWATGPVWAGVTSSEVLIDPQTGRPPTGWQTNLDETFSQRLGLAAFDPCLNLAASFVVPACNGDS